MASNLFVQAYTAGRSFSTMEDTASSFHGIGQTIARCGLFASLYTDRDSQYVTTPEGGGKVDKLNLMKVGRSL